MRICIHVGDEAYFSIAILLDIKCVNDRNSANHMPLIPTTITEAEKGLQILINLA